MAYALVQKASSGYDHDLTNQSVVDTSAELANNVGAGNTLIAVLKWYSTSPTTFTFADTGTGSSETTWTQIGSTFAGDTQKMAVFYRTATGGGKCRPSVTFSGGVTTVNYCFLYLYEFSGLASSTPLTHAFINRVNPGTGANAITSDVTGTLSAQPALIIGAISSKGSARTQTAGTTLSDGTTSITAEGTGTGYGAAVDLVFEHARVTSTSSVSVRWTDATTGAVEQYSTFVAAFEESGGDPPITDGPKLVSARSNIRFN